MAKTRTYVLIVRDESPQSMRVMDVYGFCSFSQIFDYYPMGKCRYAFIRGTNKAEIQKLVKGALGEAFQQNLNFVELYNREWHTLAK